MGESEEPQMTSNHAGMVLAALLLAAVCFAVAVPPQEDAEIGAELDADEAERIDEKQESDIQAQEDFDELGDALNDQLGQGQTPGAPPINPNATSGTPSPEKCHGKITSCCDQKAFDCNAKKDLCKDPQYSARMSTQCAVTCNACSKMMGSKPASEKLS